MISTEGILQESGDPCGAALGMRATLSKEDINALPLFHYTGKVSLVCTEREQAEAMQRLLEEKVLGFDTETPPSFSKGKSYSPSLIQLATQDEVFLFHLKRLPLGTGLIRLFENPEVIKTGVAAHDDMRFLTKLAPFNPCSVIDLNMLARKHSIENRGLRGLAAGLLGVRISKSAQCSNWASKELSPRQIRYAATDAWVSRALYMRMLDSGLALA
jgi:ribonuclease D